MIEPRTPLVNTFLLVLSLMLPTLWIESLQSGEDAQDVLEKVKKKYDDILDAELRFSQTVKFEMTNLEQSASGTLFLKKGNRYRLEVDDRTIVTDGATVWSYSPSMNQVIIDQFNSDERMLSPDKILTGAPGDFMASVLGTEKVGPSDLLVLKLVPKNDESFISVLKLWIDGSTWLVKKAEVVDFNGKMTEYEITELKINTGLDDRWFTYEIPRGVEVVDLR